METRADYKTEDPKLNYLITRLKNMAEGYRREAIKNANAEYLALGFAHTALGLEFAIMEIELMQNLRAVGVDLQALKNVVSEG